MTDVFVKGYTKPADGIAKEVELNLGSRDVAAPVAGIGLVESGVEIRHARLTLSGVVIATTDHTTSGAEGHQQLLTFPAGNILVLGAVANVTLVADGTGITTGAAVVASVGSVVAAADATLTSTEANIIPSTAATLSTLTGVMAGKSTAVALLDGTSTNAAAYLNVAVPDAGTAGAGTITATGTIDIFYKNLGDI